MSATAGQLGSASGSLCDAGGVLCDGCAGVVGGGGCAKVRVTLSGLPDCAAEANGDWVLCLIDPGDGGGEAYEGCTPNFLIRYTTGPTPALTVTGRSAALTYAPPGGGADRVVGLVFSATGGSTDPDTGVVTFATADPVDDATYPDNGCDLTPAF